MQLVPLYIGNHTCKTIKIIKYKNHRKYLNKKTTKTRERQGSSQKGTGNKSFNSIREQIFNQKNTFLFSYIYTCVFYNREYRRLF